jgi:hypothetical protein
MKMQDLILKLTADKSSGMYFSTELTIKNKKYLLKVRPDTTCRGGFRGKATTVSVWRAYGEVNENGVKPGVRGYQGPLSYKKILKLVTALEAV